MVEYRSKTDRWEAKVRSAKRSFKNNVLVPHNAAFVLIPLFMIGWFLGTISLLNRIWELQQQINSLDSEATYLELENASLELEGQYYASEEYQELAARRLLNKKLPGETLIYLPDNSEAAKTKYATTTTEEPSEAASNFSQWINYLFGY